MKPGSLSLLVLVLTCGLSGCGTRTRDALWVLADADVESVDPHAFGGRYASRNLLANVYEGLVARDADLRIVPALAVSWSNPDDTTWEFVLRDGVRFHDGTVMTATDVVESIRRAQSHPKSVVRGDLASVEDVTAPAPNVVRIHTRQPDAAILSLLPEVAIVSKSGRAIAGDITAGSFGTGPYRYVSRVRGQVAELEAFELAWSGPPAIRYVHILPFAYGSPEAARALPDKAPAVFYAIPGTPEFDRASSDYTLHDRSGLPVQYLGFDLRARESPGVKLPPGKTGNPFLDVRVRRAIALAVDYAGLRRDILGGTTRPATQLVPQEVLGFDAGIPPAATDVAAARRLMAESAYPEGFAVVLDVRQFVGEYFVPHLIQALGAIGISARAQTFGDQQFFEHLRAGKSSLYLLRFSCRTGEAQEFFDKCLHSRDEAPGYGVFNFSSDQNPSPGLDALIEEARRTLVPSRRVDRLQAVMRRVKEEQLFVPLLSERTVVFLSKGIAWKPRADGLRLFAEMKPGS